MTVALIVLTAGTSWAGDKGQGEPEVTTLEPPKLAWTEDIQPTQVMAGETVLIRIPVVIGRELHIQANPASDEFLVPLEVTFESTGDLAFGDPAYPEADAFLIEGAAEPLATYHGAIEVAVPVTPAATATPGSRQVTARLRYQACDASRCYVPADQSFTLTVVVPPPCAR